MPIEPGQTLLHYRIVDKIGEGGMGVVWKAVDTSLDREVAIKVLPEALAQDADRLARFEREAKLLASLNHPGIAGVYGLHQSEGTRFIAIELVEGEDLAVRLERGVLPMDEALAVSVQIAAAIEAAHEQGVVHRDLKPANVVLTPDCKAKVLDFGLAKALEPTAASSSGSLAMSPTMTSAGTVAGMILGTAAYMSPEQARGKPVDRRADLWSFGCVLYECLTGVRLFAGETVSDSLAAILRKDPDWSLLPEETPPMVRLLLRRCLSREPAKRLQDAGDARLELEQAIEDPSGESLGLAVSTERAVKRPSRTPWLPWAVAAAATLLAVTALLMRGGDTTKPGDTMSRRLTIPVPGATQFAENRTAPPAISPDGRYVVFGINDDAGKMHLWIRPTDDFRARQLADTEGAAYPFWSPDSAHVTFFQDNRLRRIEVATGRIQAVGGQGSAEPRGGSWNASGQILFSPNSNTGIHLIDAAGGAARQITTPDPNVTDGSHRWPWFLPDGEHFLFLFWTNSLEALEEHGGVYVASVSGNDPPVRVLSDASSVAYAAPGYILAVRGDNLIAVPFDAEERKVTGEAVVVTSGVLRNPSNGKATFSVSQEGTLVYAGGQVYLPAALTWYDREGKIVPGPLDPAPYWNLRVSPDATRAVATLPAPNGDGEIWMIDLARGVRTLLAHGATSHNYPVWSGGSNRVMYVAQEEGTMDLYSRSADGSGDAEPVLISGQDKVLYDWSRDGRFVVYWPVGLGTGTSDLWIYSVETQTSERVIGGEASYIDARFSPDTSWIAYVADDSGGNEVFVQALIIDDGVKVGARWQVSTDGGERPHWRDDGREIVYLDLEGRVMSVSFEPGSEGVRLGKPRELFVIDDVVVTADPTGDHDRFLVATRKDIVSEPIRVILDWPAGL